MNERIKQLLGQAYDEAVPETWTTLSSEQLGRVYDKFAELIVRECINIGDNYEDILGNEPECFNCRKVAYGIVDKIKQHFGVEDW